MLVCPVCPYVGPRGRARDGLDEFFWALTSLPEQFWTLKPILMTTVMVVAAMVPMALGRGPGAGTRPSIAKVLLGGQELSLLLTRLVAPVAYSLCDSVSRRLARLRRRAGSSRARPEALSPSTVG